MDLALMDCHVHIDEVPVWHPEALALFQKKPGEPRWHGVSIAEHAARIKREGLVQINAIYESPDSVIALRDAVPDIDIRAMYFLRTLTPTMRELQRLHARGLLDGIKVHPVVDQFALTPENLLGILEAARTFGVPVLYHADDRRSSMHLTAPDMQRKIVEENDDVTFIVGHGGAYANPRLTGKSPQTEAYWNGSHARRTLVTDALALVRDCPNARYDLSIVTNKTKADIVAAFLNEYPKTAARVLVGTDYPIRRSKAASQITALVRAGLRDEIVRQIASNRLP